VHRRLTFRIEDIMKPIDVFDPPMCCSTGVCGEDVDSNLVRFAADVEWLKSSGVIVRRFNLSQEPQAFMTEPEVVKLVSSEGTRCLPLLVVEGKVVSRRVYPTRDEMAVLAGIAKPGSAPAKGETMAVRGVAEPRQQSASCCSSTQASNTGCCSRWDGRP
jgi:hypothetical protein